MALSLLVAACAQPLYEWPTLRELSNQDEIHSFNRRVAIDIDNTAGAEPSENLFDVPVAVIVDASKIRPEHLADEPEIHFYDEELNLLAHEVEQWDPDTSSLVWVKVPFLPKDGSARIYLYYDYEGDVLSAAPDDVFSNSYAGVWHFSDTTEGFYRDSSGNGLHGSLSGGLVTAFKAPVSTAGKLGRGLEFKDDDMGVSIPPLSANDTKEITISMWVAVREWRQAARFFYRPNAEAYMTSQNEKLQVEFSASSSDIIISAEDMVPVNPTDPPWNSYTFIWDGQLPNLSAPYRTWGPYQNGEPFTGGDVLRNGGSGVPEGDAGQPSVIGNVNWSASPQRAPKAIIDEVRISTVVRSPHWIYVQHRSMTDTLLSFRDEERL